jgi:hypothetical protein
VRGERDVELALEQRLAYQPEVEVLQVPQAAVDELRRPRGRPDRVVGALHERDRVPARGRVERHAGARDAAADDQHVDPLCGERGDGFCSAVHRPMRLTWMSEWILLSARSPAFGDGPSSRWRASA